MEETRFLYSVYPQRPIKGILPNNRPINGPRSLSLTKEEVLTCLKFGTVYRRFANEGKNERVTMSNIDRLHNERFIMEKDYVVDSLGKDSGTVVDTAPVKTPEKAEDKVIEETKVEDTPVSEAVEEVTEDEKAEDVDSAESVVEGEAEAVEEEKESTEPQVVISNSNNFNNGKKKKHH
jgi:hypothetical protein